MLCRAIPVWVWLQFELQKFTWVSAAVTIPCCYHHYVCFKLQGDKVKYLIFCIHAQTQTGTRRKPERKSHKDQLNTVHNPVLGPLSVVHVRHRSSREGSQ